MAENESNRRLAEWQEKSAEMEARRQEVEAAYSLLTSYYQQLQEAYNALYARFCIAKADVSTETCVEADQRDDEEQCNLSVSVYSCRCCSDGFYRYFILWKKQVTSQVG